MSNQDIRQAAKSCGVCHWQIADALGIAEGTFSRLLRHELAADEKQRILKIIQKLAKGAE